MFKAIFKSNLKRWWWICALNIALLAFDVLMPVFTEKFAEVTKVVIPTGSLMGYSMLFGAVNGLALFSLLHSRRAVGLVHSLPLNRNMIFLSNAAFGALSVLLSAFVTAAAFAAAPGIKPADTFPAVLAGCWLYALAAFALSSFVSMFSGNTVAAAVFTPIITLVPFFLSGYVDVFRHRYLYGFTYSSLYDREATSVSAGNSAVWLSTGEAIALLLFSAALLLGAYIAYKKRKLEHAGEIVTFPWARVLFIQGVALCFGLLAADAPESDAASFAAYVGVGLAALVGSMMILQKTTRIKGLIKQLGIFAAIVAVIFTVFVVDVTGYGSRVPAVDDVEGLRIYGTLFRYKTVEVTDPDLISAFIQGHRRLVAERPNGLVSLQVSYKLKNGGYIDRYYGVDEEKIVNYFNDFLSSDEMKTKIYGIDKEWYGVSVTRYDGISTFLDPQELADLRAAIEADVKAMDAEKLFLGSIYGSVEVHYSSGHKDSIPLRENMINSLALYTEIREERSTTGNEQEPPALNLPNFGLDEDWNMIVVDFLTSRTRVDELRSAIQADIDANGYEALYTGGGTRYVDSFDYWYGGYEHKGRVYVVPEMTNTLKWLEDFRQDYENYVNNGGPTAYAQ